MPKKFDYTANARAFALRFPKLNHIAIQVTFWTYAFLLFATIIHFNTKSLSESYSINIPLSFGSSIILSLIMGTFYGVILGYVDIFIERSKIKNWSLGLIFLLRILVYSFVLVAAIEFTRNILWELLIIPHFFKDLAPLINHQSWKYFFYSLAIYTIVMSAAITFINLMNKKFGPGVLIPMIFGKYRNPREEERIFMFMDLKSSTTHAENLGHIKYSALIRDSFMDINQVLAKHNAEIYQYVGDEIVISWPKTSDIKGLSCVEFFFASQEQFNKRYDYYMDIYGFVPQFKAGLHLGKVTAVEVGEIKRDIAYHGDTLNTASRIQSVCNDYNKIFLVSGDVIDFIELENRYKVESIGELTLKGKNEPIGVYSIDNKTRSEE